MGRRIEPGKSRKFPHISTGFGSNPHETLAIRGMLITCFGQSQGELAQSIAKTGRALRGAGGTLQPNSVAGSPEELRQMLRCTQLHSNLYYFALNLSFTQ